MGSPVKWDSSVRNVEQETEVMALICKGDVCSMCCNTESDESDGPPRRCSQISPDRLSDSRCLYQKKRGHEVPSTTDSYNQTADTDRPAESFTVGLLPPGEVQQYCRPIIKCKSTSGVTFTSTGYGSHIQEAGSARNRGVYIGRDKDSAKISDTSSLKRRYVFGKVHNRNVLHSNKTCIMY
ncbi:uncharacterized protein LOC125236498 isoform X2 [Leguminivora glycinivorella]|uniref:uncharacterized protein LOC125236498 isoform X2 n=1 Tax=Leguminivora glycinivorella TaxID=1035111 RepID=UPI00200F71D4|nr:uncharacterized protein LOC125236498 isoform X2 [Leguminivora glycinivorella]